MADHRSTRSARLRRFALAGLLVAGLTAGGAATATAAPTAATATDGWTRIAHLSPDTVAVDVRLTALAGGGVLYELKNIAYGAVSDYLAMPAGTYVVSMVPAGTDPSGTAVVSESITVAAGEPLTVAAYGTNDDLKTAVYRDDLTTPAGGESRVRVIQASTVANSVSITTTTGLPVAEGIRQGVATSYATVPAGAWDLKLGGDAQGSTAVDLGGGTVNTLLVLDTAERGFTIKPLLDAAAPGSTPAAGIDTGGGWAATAPAAESSGARATGAGPGLGALLGLCLVTIALARRQRAAADAAADTDVVVDASRDE